MLDYREQLAFGAIVFMIGIAGLSWRLYRLFVRPITRPMIQIYIILLGFFLLGLFGLYTMARAHRLHDTVVPHLRDVVPAPMLFARTASSYSPYALQALPLQQGTNVAACSKGIGNA